MKIFIIFAGLIVQVDQPLTWVNTAVLPNAAGTHVAELVVPVAAIVNPQEALTHGRREGDHFVVPLEDARLIVEGTRGYRTPRTDAYRASVPKLRRPKSNCATVKSEIRERAAGAGFAYVDFRGGRQLAPHTYLLDKLTFDRTADPEGNCASCAVRWEADLHGDEATLVLHRGGRRVGEVRVRGGAEVLVRNAPVQKSGSHFHHMYDIYTDCTSRPVPAVTMPCEEGETCDENTYNWGTLGRVTWPTNDCSITDEP